MTRQTDTYRRIRVHERRTLTGNGDVLADAQLCCPRDDLMTTLARCAACGHCDGLVNEGGEAPFIFCDLVSTPKRRPFTSAMLEPGAGVGAVSVNEIMAQEVACVRPEVGLDVVSKMFVDTGLGSSSVVDEDGIPLGMISKRDVFRELRRAEEEARRQGLEVSGATIGELLSRRCVGDAMVSGVATVRDGTTVCAAAAQMVAATVQYVLVVDGLGRVVGSLSSLDILRLLATRGGYLAASEAPKKRACHP